MEQLGGGILILYTFKHTIFMLGCPRTMCTKLLLTLHLIEMPFDAFANRADPDQAALVRAA